MFTDLGAPADKDKNGQHDLEMLKFEFACELEQAGSLNEAARELTQQNTKLTEETYSKMRPVVIWRLCRLRARLGEPRDATVQLLRDGLAFCRTTELRGLLWVHSFIAFDLACHIVQSSDGSIDGSEAPCGSLAEAEGMLREALLLVGEERDEDKASILVSLADLMHRQSRDGEAHQAQQELRILQRKYNAAEADGAAPSRPNKRRTRRGNRNRGGEQQEISS